MFNNKKDIYIKSIIHDRYKQISSKLLRLDRDSKYYFKRPILAVDDGTEYLKSLVMRGTPCVAGRFGTSECAAFVRHCKNEIFGLSKYGSIANVLCNNAGFYPNDNSLIDRYCDYVFDLLPDLDLLCTMNTVGESYIVKEYARNATLTLLPVVDPCITEWTSVLEGKTILVIHPFADLIEMQYRTSQSKIYEGYDILPTFNLQTIQAVQSIAGNTDSRFETWFDALEYMYQEAMSKSFDIALVGCGAYGLPLAIKLKQAGKIAIHMGGCLQLLFGIRGNRWDNLDYMQKYYNDAWVRPGIGDIPNNSQRIEKGCYW